MGPTLSVWLEVLVAFGPDALGPESDELTRWQCEIVAKAVNDEADCMGREPGQNGLANRASPDVPSICRQEQPPKEQRDKWLYDECVKGTPYQAIAIRLKKKPEKWTRIESVNGIKMAAQRYAERNSLPRPSARQSGRRSG